MFDGGLNGSVVTVIAAVRSAVIRPVVRANVAVIAVIACVPESLTDLVVRAAPVDEQDELPLHVATVDAAADRLAAAGDEPASLPRKDGGAVHGPRLGGLADRRR